MGTREANNKAINMTNAQDHSEAVGNQGKKKPAKKAEDMGKALRRRLCEEQRERKANDNWWGE